MANFGDRPRFPLPSQRIDKVDVEAISEMKEAALMRLFGSIMGTSFGLLSDVGLSWDGPSNTLTIGKCHLGYSRLGNGYVEETSEYGVEGGTVRHDPDLGSPSDISFTEAAFPTGYIFFEPVWVPADEENRAYWDGLSKQKKVGLANTRLRERVVFHVDQTAERENRIAEGKYPFLYIQGWAAGVPGLVRIHYFESGQFTGGTYDLLLQRGGTSPAVLPHTDIGEAFGDFRARGLAQITRAVLATLCKVMDSDWTFDANFKTTTNGAVGWNSNPDMGLKQIYDYINATVDSRIKLALNTNARILFYDAVEADATPTRINSIGLGTGGDYITEPLIIAGPAGGVYTDLGTGQTRLTFSHALLTTESHVFVTCLEAQGTVIHQVNNSTTVTIYQYSADGTTPAYKNFSILVVGRADNTLPPIP